MSYVDGQQLFVAQHSAVKIKISSNFLNAIRVFQRENVGHEKLVHDLAVSFRLERGGQFESGFQIISL
ncbi:MAG: hypothetical protein RIR39_1333 [Pseudomonadota bacterium]